MATSSAPRYRFDEKVVLTFILVGAVSLFVLAFRFKGQRPCPSDISIGTTGGYFQGTPIRLTAFAKGAQSFEWEFGDGSPSETTTVPTVLHTYKEAKRYTVKLTVNGQCEEWKELRIIAPPVVVDMRMAPEFTGPESALVNQPVTFTDNTGDANAWEWRSGENGEIGEVANTSRQAVFVFKTPGVKDVYLKVNGRNDRAAIHKILIKEDPRMKAEEQKKNKAGGGPVIKYVPISDTPTGKKNVVEEVKKEEWPTASNAELGEWLKQVASGKKTPADFSKYLCDQNVEVLYNNEKMTFTEMCTRIRQKMESGKYVKSVSVSQFKIDNGCITSLNVNMEKYGALKRVFISKKEE